MSTASNAPCIDTALGIQLTGQDEALYFEFLRRFPSDDTLSRLAAAINARDGQQAFRYAHMLKGLCAQLALTALEEASAALCNLLRERPDDMDAAALAFAAVKYAHKQTTDAIAKL